MKEKQLANTRFHVEGEGEIIKRRGSVSGHRYPMPHLSRGVKIVGRRWGIGPEGVDAPYP